MKKFIRTLGMLSLLPGFYFLKVFVECIVNFSKAGFHLFDLVFFFIFPFWLIAFSVFCFFVAFESWKNFSSKTVRRIVTILILLVWFFGVASTQFFDLKNSVSDIILFLFVVLSIVVYRTLAGLILKSIFPMEELPPLQRATLQLVAFLAWSTCLGVLKDWFPSKLGFDISSRQGLELILFLGSIIFVWVAYKISVKMFIGDGI